MAPDRSPILAGEQVPRAGGAGRGHLLPLLPLQDPRQDLRDRARSHSPLILIINKALINFGTLEFSRMFYLGTLLLNCY